MLLVWFWAAVLFLPAHAAASSWGLNWLWGPGSNPVPSDELQHINNPDVEPLVSMFARLNAAYKSAPCRACKKALHVLQQATRHDHGTLAAVLYGVCSDRARPNGLFQKVCENLHLYQFPSANDGFSFLPDFANTLSMMDTEGLDGEYLCHYMFSNACPRPQTPRVDYEAYWSPRPESVTRQRNGTTFKVLHVSDVHLSINYTEGAAANCLGAMCCDPYSFQDPFADGLSAPKFGHWRCDAPPALLESAMQDTERLDYDFALFTGDMVDHNPVFINKHDTQLEEAETMRALKRHLGDVPVYAVLGNHDSYPYSQEPPPNSPYADRTNFNIELMEHLWSDFGWVKGRAANQVKLTHGGYSIEPVDGLKIISLNSNYWYRWNFYNYVDMADPDPSGILQFLIDELVDCEERGLRAWVQAHVAPGGLPDEALPPAASFFTAILERFSDIITGQFFGHTHLDEFTVLYGHNATRKSEENALNVAWIAPSITPYTDLNPGWRYYEVDANTFEIMDAVTVATEIEPYFELPWLHTPRLDWSVLYSARELYGSKFDWPETEPLNGKFWHRVAHELLTDQDFAEEFVKRSYRFSSMAPECLELKCRTERYCYATSMTPDQVELCHEELQAGKRVRPGKQHRPKPLDGVPSFPMPRPGRDRQG